MFEKLRKIFKNRKEKEKHNYDLTFDNVAIPEVHVKSTESHEDTNKENAPISYDNVAIPEVHIRNKKINKLNNMYIMQKGLPRAMSKFLT
ncbi:MAG: hypothetical protein ACLTLY_10525 [Agathobacter rectalis]